MSFVRVPPDSTGKKIHTIENTVGGDLVQTQAVYIVGKDNPNNRMNVDVRGSASVRFAEGQPILSGFGNLKTTSQRALGVYESSLDTYDDLFSVVETTGGASTYDPQAASTVLTVTGAYGSSVKRTTNRYHYYLPGTSNFIAQTIAVGDTGKVGNTRRWGAFDDKDGIFFELSGTTLNVVIRSSTSGSIVETKIPQSSFNNDQLNGLGWSGVTLDPTKINIYWMDYQWLGAGRVRFGIFEPSGARLVCHEIFNAGAHTLPYMRTGTLPLRTENINTGTTGSSSELREVCMSMYTEGEFADYTFWRSADMEVTKTVTAGDNHLFSLKSKTLIQGHHNSVQCYPETLNVYTDRPVAVTIWQNTLVTGGAWALSSDSSIDGTLDGTVSFTNARKFKTIYFNIGASESDLTEYFEVNDEGIMLAADGTPNYWTFTATRLDNQNAAVTVSLGYRELW